MEYNGINTRHYRRLSASGYATFLVFFWEPINRAYLNLLLEMLPHRTSHVRSMQWRGPPQWPGMSASVIYSPSWRKTVLLGTVGCGTERAARNLMVPAGSSARGPLRLCKGRKRLLPR